MMLAERKNPKCAYGLNVAGKAYPAAATSPADASETNSLAIRSTSGSRASGGTWVCAAIARDARKDVTDCCFGVKYLMNQESCFVSFHCSGHRLWRLEKTHRVQ